MKTQCWLLSSLLLCSILSCSLDGSAPVVVTGREYGVVGNGVVDDSKALQRAVDESPNGVCVLLSPGIYKLTKPLLLRSGSCLMGFSIGERWRTGATRPMIAYSGPLAAIVVRPGAGQVYDSVNIFGVQIDGSGAFGAVDGVLLDGSAGYGAAVEGVMLENTAVTNFPRHQIHAIGVVFDVVFKRFTAHNSGRAADDLVTFTYPGYGAAPSQVQFFDCWLAPYSDGRWAVSADIVSDMNFYGGTIAPQAVGIGANGLSVSGGLSLWGTHLEGIAGQRATIGIRYTGTNGAQISPGLLATFGVGVQIGSALGPQRPAVAARIDGNICNNNYLSGGVDIEILAGGSRERTIIAGVGACNAGPAIRNLRQTTDGVFTDVVNLTSSSSGSRSSASLSNRLALLLEPSFFPEVILDSALRN